MINNCNSYSVINKNLTNKIKIIPLLSYTLQYYRKGSNCRKINRNPNVNSRNSMLIEVLILYSILAVFFQH